MPCTTDDSATTTKTPMPTPRIVSAARPLLARIASKAIVTPSNAWMNRVKRFIPLLLPQGFDRVEPRRAPCRAHAGDDAHDHAKQSRGDDRPRGHGRRQWRI